ncbi:MAG: S-layer homology domain-containing protein [Armatimonadetes bacterium]|nr:S-layer homology domain-containing protein [Armatimonadota bacterium]
MNRTLKLAFGAVLGSALFASASGQNFPDVPEYHWAYAALLNMKREGILVGYPDGLFRGGRPTSRYELASAINAAYLKLRGMVGGVTNQIDALNSQIDALKGYSHDEYLTASDLDSLRSALEQLRSDLNAMKGWGDDIAAADQRPRRADLPQNRGRSLGQDRVLPRRHLDNVTQLTHAEHIAWAKILKKILKKIGKLGLPYNYYFHQVINDEDQHFYMKIIPRGSVWAGVEIGSGVIINPIPPEEAAIYYKK